MTTSASVPLASRRNGGVSLNLPGAGAEFGQ